MFCQWLASSSEENVDTYGQIFFSSVSFPNWVVHFTCLQVPKKSKASSRHDVRMDRYHGAPCENSSSEVFFSFCRVRFGIQASLISRVQPSKGSTVARHLSS